MLPKMCIAAVITIAIGRLPHVVARYYRAGTLTEKIDEIEYEITDGFIQVIREEKEL